MTDYNVTVGKELLPELLSSQNGLAKLVEGILNQIKETVRRLAVTGLIPGAKVGRGRFIEQDLVTYMRNKYSTCDASQGVNMRSIDIWHSTKEMGSGGLTSAIRENAYAKALGLK